MSEWKQASPMETFAMIEQEAREEAEGKARGRERARQVAEATEMTEFAFGVSAEEMGPEQRKFIEQVRAQRNDGSRPRYGGFSMPDVHLRRPQKG